MSGLFSQIQARLQTGESVVLCRIIDASGSTPRGAGARMAVYQDGSTSGTIGGGAVELRSIRIGGELLQEGGSRTCSFHLTPGDIEDIGMICGGDVTLLFQYLSPDHLPLVQAITAAMEAGGPSWLVTDLWEDGRWEMAVDKTGDGPLFARRPMLQEGTPRRYVEPLCAEGGVYIFGAGHVGNALARLLDWIGFSVTVFDDRPHALEESLFPEGVRRILCRGHEPRPQDGLPDPGAGPADKGGVYRLHWKPPEGGRHPCPSPGGRLLPGGHRRHPLPHRSAHRRRNPGGDRRVCGGGADRPPVGKAGAAWVSGESGASSRW